MCVVEHPKSVGDKFQNGERTRFRIGQTYYMGNGMKLYKGVEVPYSCDDKEFKNVDFSNTEESENNRIAVNANIKDIQMFLTDEGYDISSDGQIGSETSGAIIDYIVDNNSDEFKPASVLELQKKINSCYSMNIKEDGKVGPETLDAIADALESAQDGNLCK
jgi:lysozyme family protein